ncbi:L10-interacting MYB domain-containing protein-like [Gossypium raimondii]|uniref:L10-interacting MYB domain-containing protein-like n=1 Tax=Gossypium raimondii TaxID=29730 RepID=UPI00227D4FCB|nr:L10-interacting MYB domain-containing protein-like [Gossypium raimondii]
MVKTRNFVEGDSSLATKAVWDDELTLIFCELCVNEVNASNRPTTHLNSKGWENEWRLWRELLKESTGIGWCSFKKTVDATEEWWAEKIQENPNFKGFKKKGIKPRLNELMWQMFSGIVATGENAWAPSSGVLPRGVPMGDDAPNEGFGDSDEHSNENEGIPPNEVPSNPSHEISNRRKQTLGVVHDALRALGDEIPKRDELYYFATKMFQIPVKREMFLNLYPDDRVWWLQHEYAEQNPIASFSSLVATSSFPFQPYHQPPPPSAP